MNFLQLIALIGTLGLTAAQLELPDPRIVIVGPTGSGKSSLANALLGCDPLSNDCTFNVCPDLDSCTKQTSIGTGPWLGTGQNFTVVDTPGFGDSDGQDNKLIEEMMKVLDDSLGYSNTILLLFDGQTARFTTGLHNMLRQMSSLFGDAWWDFMVIGVSKWKYSQDAIDGRQEHCDYYPESCKDEAWFMRNINGQLQEKFHLARNFSFAFIDSYSQSAPELHDQVQQEHYQAEAEILWDSATTRNSTFDFKTIDDVLEENDFLKKENKRLNDIIETNITTLFSLVHKNEDRIDGNEERSLGNTKNITSIEGKTDVMNGILEGVVNNVDNLLSDVDGNGKRIDTMNGILEGVVNDVENLRSDIDGNEKRIDSNEENIVSIEEKTNVMNGILEGVVDDVKNLRSAPIGTILAWVSKPTKETEEFADIPAGWHRCDGTQIPHQSIWAGQKTPDLNNVKRFLRGGNDTDMLNLEADQLQDHTHNINDPTHSHGYKDYYVGGSPGYGPDGSNYNLDRFMAEASRTSSKSSTGITVKGVNSLYRRGSETRPKNMNVIYIMRVW